jgi:tetracycline resistance efflux pump
MDHTITQLPYALVAAGASAIGFVVLGLTQNTWLGLLAAVVALALAIAVLRARSPEYEAQPAAEGVEPATGRPV